MTFKQRVSSATKHQWFWFAVWVAATLLFSLWAGSPWILLFILLFFDIYITSSSLVLLEEIEERTLPQDHGMGGCHPFALVAVYFINTFFFRTIRYPPLHWKSHCWWVISAVSKLSYGPRAPITPPLSTGTTHHAGGGWQVIY